MVPIFCNPPTIPGTVVRAPGKLVIAGEFAVIDGAPSIVMAINRGVEAIVTKDKGIQTPNGDTRFVQHANSSEYGLHFRDWNPVADLSGDKPGFGGSAAACVVATAFSEHSLESAVQIHRNVQGSGSGIDVIASLYGGVFLWDSETQEHTTLPEIHPVVIWTGTSAKTGPRVEQYINYRNRQWFIDNSTRFTFQFLQNPILATKALYNNLVQMSKEAGIDYSTDSIEEIVELALQHEGAAKPSGAGGGDCVIAFFQTKHSASAFCKDIDAHPIFKRIPVQVSKGVHVVQPTN